MRNRLGIVALLLSCLIAAALSQDFPLLKPEDLQGARIERTDFYPGQALFGYIDGGAELYLEYGFKKLGRQEVQYANEKFILEIHQMAGANEAYGIFSVQRFKCTPLDSLFPNTCQSKYQLQAVGGNCYISIVNASGSDAARSGSIDLLRALMVRMEPLDLSLPSIFRDPKLKPFMRNLVIANGPLGLQNGFLDWLPFFESFQTFTVFILPIEVGSNHLILAYTNIPCCGEIEEFARLAGYDGMLTETLQSQTIEGSHLFVQKLGKQTLIFAVGSGSISELSEYLRSLSH